MQLLTSLLLQVEKFVEEECIPADSVFHAQLGEGKQRWSQYPSIIDKLKARAKKLGLWNMFLPKNHFKEGAGFFNLEYGLMAEYLSKSRCASEMRNANCIPLAVVDACTDTEMPGCQLRRTRHWEYGSVCKVRQCGTEEDVARPTLE